MHHTACDHLQLAPVSRSRQSLCMRPCGTEWSLHLCILCVLQMVKVKHVPVDWRRCARSRQAVNMRKLRLLGASGPWVAHGGGAARTGVAWADYIKISSFSFGTSLAGLEEARRVPSAT